MDDVTTGSAFLVARGRRRGHRTILAPSFLVRRGIHALLADAIGWSGPTRSRDGSSLGAGDAGRITVTWTAGTLTRADLDAGDAGGSAPVTDEQGRPLQMVYGIVTEGRLSGEVDDDDLGRARKQAVESYRRFLLDEDGFEVDSADAFVLRELRSVPPRATTRRRPRPAQVPARVDARARRALSSPAIVVAIVVALGLIVLGVLLLLLADDTSPPPRARDRRLDHLGGVARACGGGEVDRADRAGRRGHPSSYEPRRSALGLPAGPGSSSTRVPTASPRN